MTQTDLAFVLHSRDYRETSLIVRLFARGAGRFSAVYRGARRRRGSPVQPFSLLQVRWRGRAELKTLTGVELDEAFHLRGRRLYIGLYLNELLTRLLHEHEAQETLFDQYHFLLRQLRADADIEPLLRHFELLLLRELGYGIALDVDADSGEPLEPDAVYRFHPESGLHREPAAGPPSLPASTSSPSGGGISTAGRCASAPSA